MPLRVAVLEDDVAQAELLCEWLTKQDYFCHHFSNGRDFLRKTTNESYDLYLVDWELPDIDGIEVVGTLLSNSAIQAPIFFTTARNSESDIVRGLECGADDYLIKPLRKMELYARIHAAFRSIRLRTKEGVSLEFPPYVFNKKNESVSLHGENVILTSLEFKVALFLFENLGRVLSRGHILERIWGVRSDINTRTVDTHVCVVRSKLQLRPTNGWRLTSIYRHGYRLEKFNMTEC